MDIEKEIEDFGKIVEKAGFILERAFKADVEIAMIQIRSFRAECMIYGVHPISQRIAIKYMLAIDSHCAKDHIDQETDDLIDKIVEMMVKQQIEKHKDKQMRINIG